MHPILFQYKFITIHTYGFFVALGVLVGTFFIKREAERLNKDVDQILNYVFYGIILSFIGCRALFVIIYFDNFSNNLLDIFKVWEGGLVFYGAPLVALIYSFFYLKKNRMAFWETADVVIVGVPIGQFLGRFGCLSAGCCYGRSCDLPWSVTFHNLNAIAPIDIPLHPTQLYSAFFNLIIFFVIMLFRKRKKFNGQLVCLYLGLYGVTRFIVECFRGDPRGNIFLNFLSTSQTISLFMILFALISYFYLMRKNKNRDLRT